MFLAFVIGRGEPDRLRDQRAREFGDEGEGDGAAAEQAHGSLSQDGSGRPPRVAPVGWGLTRPAGLHELPIEPRKYAGAAGERWSGAISPGPADRRQTRPRRRAGDRAVEDHRGSGAVGTDVSGCATPNCPDRLRPPVQRQNHRTWLNDPNPPTSVQADPTKAKEGGREHRPRRGFRYRTDFADCIDHVEVQEISANDLTEIEAAEV